MALANVGGCNEHPRKLRRDPLQTCCWFRQDFVAEAGASRKSVEPWEFSVGTQIEWRTRWWTRFGAVLGRLSVGRAYVRKWPVMVRIVRRYGRCCMYGPNYVKLSRVFAVQLFSMFSGHYAALPPVRSDPHWSHSHAIIRRSSSSTGAPSDPA
jgi:hypothetical protein